MKFLDEYRDAELSKRLLERIAAITTRSWVLMEVCGGQTHSIVRYGIDRLLPSSIELVHGPGCPVCVTPVEMIDRAHAIARMPGVIFTSFGDMLRVPGSHGDLLSVRARGADVRVVYSPLDAVTLARANPGRDVVFFGVGFETTAPANALAVERAAAEKLDNFSLLSSHVLVPPAMASILQSPDNRVQGFLGPGHVCSITGFREYEALAAHYGCPIVITGFEPVDLLAGIFRVISALESGRHGVQNAYARGVTPDGNPRARALIENVFEVTDKKWRGIGTIPKSGLRVRSDYARFDAARRFDVTEISPEESRRCIAGLVLRGQKKPCDCSAFARDCTPLTPLGATMVSAEGACRAYYAHRRTGGAERKEAS